MGMNAVQTYVKDLLDGLESPLYTSNLVAYINPPNPGKLRGPAVFVWATNGTNRRQTAPRGHGFSSVPWIVNCWLMAPGNSSDDDADSAFACLVDAVAEAWATAPMPLLYTDPVTNVVTQFTAIGEEWSVEQSPVHSTVDQRIVIYEALFRGTLLENTQR